LKRIANWFIAPLQFLIGIVHRWLMFLSAEGIQIWGSNPAILWTGSQIEEEGIHIHAAGAGILRRATTF
jgi:hypothetical protein